MGTRKLWYSRDVTSTPLLMLAQSMCKLPLLPTLYSSAPNPTVHPLLCNSLVIVVGPAATWLCLQLQIEAAGRGGKWWCSHSHIFSVRWGMGGCLEPHMSEYNVMVFSCIIGYKLRLGVSRYSQLAIYPATPNVNMYNLGGPGGASLHSPLLGTSPGTTLGMCGVVVCIVGLCNLSHD